MGSCRPLMAVLALELKNLVGVPCIAAFQELMSFASHARIGLISPQLQLNSDGQGTQMSSGSR